MRKCINFFQISIQLHQIIERTRVARSSTSSQQNLEFIQREVQIHGPPEAMVLQDTRC
jgi:hypothetical protein